MNKTPLSPGLLDLPASYEDGKRSRVADLRLGVSGYRKATALVSLVNIYVYRSLNDRGTGHPSPAAVYTINRQNSAL